MTQEECIAKYGDINDHHWSMEDAYMVTIMVASDCPKSWINSATGDPVHKIYCNKDFAGPFFKAITNLRRSGLFTELHTFDGCFNIRDVRGHPGELSAHSWGLAIDLNAAENPLGSESKFSDNFVMAFKDAGFRWGGDFERKDPQHFTLGW